MSPDSRKEPPLDPRGKALNDNPTVPSTFNSDVGESGNRDKDVSIDETSLPEELTGRASGTGEDLEALFENTSDEHLADGFRAGNGDDPETDVERSDDQDELDTR